MLRLTKQHELEFSFQEVHPQARLNIQLQRTLRSPDDGKDYPLPAGLGCFPVHHVDDHADRVPGSWLKRAGVMVPMHPTEALWLNFETALVESQGRYPFAIRVGTGKINAITGKPWGASLMRGPQNYAVAPNQPWLDGYAVGDGVVRQFVAMPMGKGYTVEEQITGSDNFGGIQVQVYPMKREVFERRFPVRPPVRFSIAEDPCKFSIANDTPDMGIAPGGRIKQQVYEDEYELADWDQAQMRRCFIHLCDAARWRALTGAKPPRKPIRPREYRDGGLPWFNFFRKKSKTLKGSTKLASLETVADHAKTIGDPPLNDNVAADDIEAIHAQAREVRDRDW